MRLVAVAFLFLVLGGYWAKNVAQSPAREVFILAGQSNMAGRGDLSELPVFPNAARVSIFKGAWRNPGTEPVGTDSSAVAGPGMAFADRLAEVRPSVEIGLVPCAVGGTSIADWEPDWRKETLFGACLALARAAAPSGSIKGLLWYQGESDTDSLAKVMAWPSRFRSLVIAFRQELGLPSLPVVLTKLGREPNVEPWVNWRRMQLYQQQIGDAGIPGVRFVDASDLPVNPANPLHLTTTGYVALGRRYADMMHTLY